MTRGRRLFLALGLLFMTTAQAAPVTVTVPAQADVALGRGNPNASRGSERELELRSGERDRVLVKMDPAAVRDAVGTGRLVAARLELDIVDGAGPKRALTRVDVHPVTRDWAEAGATWNCANDANTANNKPDCAAADVWSLDGAAAPWGPVTAGVDVGPDNAVVGLDVMADVSALLNGNGGYGWVVKKAAEDARVKLTFAARERGARGPRLVLSVEPQARSGWINWDGSAGQVLRLPSSQQQRQDALTLSPDRVLWAGGEGQLRLFAVDRERHETRLLAETSLRALLPDSPATFNWYQGRSLFRLADGGVVLFFEGYGLGAVTLDVDDAGIRPRGAPFFIEAPAMGEGHGYYLYRTTATQVADGRFLIAYQPDGERSYLSAFLRLWETPPAGLSLYGEASLADGVLTLTEAGSASGVAVWEVDIQEGYALNINVSGTAETGSFSVVVDREPGFNVVSPISSRPRYSFGDHIEFSFLAPYTGKAYVKMMAPSVSGGRTTVNYASLSGELAPPLLVRRFDLNGGTAVLGPAVQVPNDVAGGRYTEIGTQTLTNVDGQRVLLHVNTKDPDNGFGHAITRMLTLTDSGIALGDWAEIVPSTMGPDWYFSEALNTDTRAEGVRSSIASDAMHDEPLVGPFALAGDRVIPTGARLVESRDGDYRNQIAYLGGNEYLFAQRVNSGYDQPGAAHQGHLFVMRSDGQGTLLQQVGPFETPGRLDYPLIQVLDKDHVLLLWEDEETTYNEYSGWDWSINLNAKVLYKH